MEKRRKRLARAEWIIISTAMTDNYVQQVYGHFMAVSKTKH